MVSSRNKRELLAFWSIALLWGLFSLVMSSLPAPARELEKSVSEIHTFDSEKIVKKLQESRKDQVMVMLDIDGTLTRHDEEPEMKRNIKAFSRKLLENLREQGYVVYLNTGKPKKSLEEEWNIEGIGYVAEHGAITKKPGEAPIYVPGVKEWKKRISSRLEAQWSNGWPGNAKMISDKEATISFFTRQANNDFKTFVENLKSLLGDEAEVHSSEETLVSITKPGINKGTAIEGVMESHKSVTSALVAGDDDQDTEMFGKMREKLGDGNVYALIITRDEEKVTKANYKVQNFRQFLRFLASLVNLEWPTELDLMMHQ